MNDTDLKSLHSRALIGLMEKIRDELSCRNDAECNFSQELADKLNYAGIYSREEICWAFESKDKSLSHLSVSDGDEIRDYLRYG